MTTIDTGAAKLPSLPPVNAQDPALRNWINAVTERLEVREGSRGNPAERVVTQRELAEIKKVISGLSSVKRAGDNDLAIALGGGLTAYVGIAEFENAVFNTRLWKDLQYSLDDPRRFDYLSSELRTLIETSIASEAAKRGADIQTTQLKIQDANRSIAALTTEITAALNNNAAGLRSMQATYVSSTSATAVQVTQLESSLGNYYQDGTAGRAQLEETLLTQAEYISGLNAQYTLKVTAGGAIAGFGLSATESNGTPSSAFIIQADKFAVVAPSYSGGLTTSPSVANMPFGVDASGVYINGDLLVNGSVTADKVNGQNLVVYAGAYSSTYTWPASGTGFHLSQSGLLLGNYNTGSWFQVEANGNVNASQFNITNGNASFSGNLAAASGTFTGTVYVENLTGDVNKIVAVTGDYLFGALTTDNWVTVGTAVLPASSHSNGHIPSAIITLYLTTFGGRGSGAIRLLINGSVVGESHSYLDNTATVTVAGAVGRTTSSTTFTLQATGTAGYTVYAGQIRGYIMGVR